MIFDRAFRHIKNEAAPEYFTFADTQGWLTGETLGNGQSAAMKLSAVNRCVNCLTDSMSKLPVYVFNEETKERMPNHPLNKLLSVRPNEAMTPSVYKKLMETNRLLNGNAYALIVRNPYNAEPMELIPLPPSACTPFVDGAGKLFYGYTDPRTGERRKLEAFDVVHYKAFSLDGVTGVSVLSYASAIIQTAQAAQKYEGKFYSQYAQPGGVITVDATLDKKAKDAVREEWEKVHSGPDNAFRLAVLDLGMKYQQISVSQKDAQFIESKGVTIEDISRFFGVPLYKLGVGKQAYNSNEQNGIEYVVNTLHPIVSQCDEEDAYKLLFDREIRKGLWIQRNMMAELKGDIHSRGAWYRIMRDTGVFSVNDICDLEDRPRVPGGDTRNASLNFVPLDLFRELSVNRNGGNKQE